jgi:hypothetical protein
MRTPATSAMRGGARTNARAPASARQHTQVCTSAMSEANAFSTCKLISLHTMTRCLLHVLILPAHMPCPAPLPQAHGRRRADPCRPASHVCGYVNPCPTRLMPINYILSIAIVLFERGGHRTAELAAAELAALRQSSFYSGAVPYHTLNLSLAHRNAEENAIRSRTMTCSNEVLAVHACPKAHE